MSTSIRISDDIVYRDIEGAIVALSLASGEYVAFDAIGSRIWRLIDELGSLPLITARLLAEYELDEETCQREVDAFIRALCAKGLVAIPADGPR